MSEDIDDIYVKVHDFPLEMDNDKIRKALTIWTSKIRNDTYTCQGLYPVASGARSVLIAMKKDIPSYITIENETSLVTYKGQPRKCRLSDNPNHEMSNCPTKPANRMKLIRQQNDPTNPNTLGATFVQVLTKKIVPGNETEPEVIKENANYSNARNMVENDNNMENIDTQNATEIENSQEPESSADDEEPKIDSSREEVLNEGI
ncbi:hypothetical protein HHI36_001994 [Cryptolaemus montrouzieri]|uniref:Uncharacterized protein n=1 Tax=Cryptolaemus montrouzieri TaxID=559131 RepID=A0ABD2PAK8_9CUCU